MSHDLYQLTIAGSTPVTAELVPGEFGEPELMQIRIGALVLVVTGDLADELADAIIDTVAERPAPVRPAL